MSSSGKMSPNDAQGFAAVGSKQLLRLLYWKESLFDTFIIKENEDDKKTGRKNSWEAIAQLFAILFVFFVF